MLLHFIRLSNVGGSIEFSDIVSHSHLGELGVIGGKVKVIFTNVDVSYACSELGGALIGSLPGIIKVAHEFAGSEGSNRRLVVVTCCPCCSKMGVDIQAGDILVTPFHGIDPERFSIAEIPVYPPFRTPGEDGEAESTEEFAQAWRETIKKALL